jgi:uncharacterized protein (TIGR02145 family)
MKSVKKYFVLLFLLTLTCSPFSCKKDLLKLVSVTPGTYIDTRDGRTYKTTTIGDYTWLAENLDFKTDSGSCYYDNDSLTNHEYGRLYTWQAAQAAVPPGWHLPTTADLKYLYDNLGGNGESAQICEDGNNYSGLSIIPGGCYDSTLTQFKGKGQGACFWETGHSIWGVNSYIQYLNLSGAMLSVRCVKNY